MPTHPRDGINRLRYLLEEELRKKRHPGILKIRKGDDRYELDYLSLSDQKIPKEFPDLVAKALLTFSSTDPSGYNKFKKMITDNELISYLVKFS